MTWSRQRPSGPGWYWWREDETSSPVVARVGWDTINKTSLFMIVPPHTIWDGPFMMEMDTAQGLWAGPLESPLIPLPKRFRPAIRRSDK